MSSNKINEWIDQNCGACILKDEAVRRLVTDSLHHHDGRSYDLIAYVVMPNHVHLMMTPYRDTTTIMHSIKRFTATQINKYLGQTDPVWQREYFDHLVRSAASFEKFIAYIRQNPQFLPTSEFSLYIK